MKKPSIFIMAALLSLAPVISHAVPPTQAQIDAAQIVLNTVEAASAADRELLVRQAIQADPTIAGALISLLITEFPDQAAFYTDVVVTTVLNLPVASTSNDAKAAILTSVAEAAVRAALLIPDTRVVSVVESVNAVKRALAQVANSSIVEIANSVGLYTQPLAEGSNLILVNNKTVEVIVSGDSIISQ